MNFKAYIQAENGFPISDWAADAYIGFRDKGTEIILFEDIEEVPNSKNSIVVAFIEDTVKYFDRVGIKTPEPLNVPKSLIKYLGRSFTREIQIKDIKDLPVFIKPSRKVKSFPSGIATTPETLRSLPQEEYAFTSEVKDFSSEYRAYIYDKKIQGLYWYQGDFRIFPNINVIDRMIEEYKDAPAGYSIDVGITSSGTTLLMECNDGWGLGNYGLEPKKYVNLLTKRWLELIR